MGQNRYLASQFPPGFESDSSNLAIDFDGVIHDDYLGFHDGTCYGPLIRGSSRALELLSRRYRLVVFTAKAKPSRPKINGKTGQELVWEWLRENQIDAFIAEVTSEKPRAIAYIDDKAIKFNSWDEIFSMDLFLNLQENFQDSSDKSGGS